MYVRSHHVCAPGHTDTGIVSQNWAMVAAAFTPATNPDTITYPIHTDHLGGANVVTDEGGEVTEVSDYSPFGSLRIDDQAGSFTEQRKFIGNDRNLSVIARLLQEPHRRYQ